MKHWEYAIDDMSEVGFDDECSLLEHRGTQGWELVSIVTNGTKYRRFYFKREKINKTPWTKTDSS